jgi:lipopolysaccharide/colanic/teichoic acid biosynthesis glycosyltransferase
MKRIVDVVVASAGLLACLPLLTVFSLLVWLEDRRSPVYVPLRVGRHGTPFRMLKLRSMVVGADQSKVDSTASQDARITRIGRVMRRSKFDELPQLWNVLVGQMSLVGPRPNIDRETALYSHIEQRLLSIRPGITDIASIVFADEGEILNGHEDANIAYNQLIRPYKSSLGLLYVDHASLALDLELMALTVFNAVNRPAVLNRLANRVQALGADDALVQVVRRESPLIPAPPPGHREIVRSRGA